MLFSSPYVVLTKADHILKPKTHLNIYQRIEIICLLSYTMELSYIKNRKITAIFRRECGNIKQKAEGKDNRITLYVGRRKTLWGVSILSEVWEKVIGSFLKVKNCDPINKDHFCYWVRMCIRAWKRWQGRGAVKLVWQWSGKTEDVACSKRCQNRGR